MIRIIGSKTLQGLSDKNEIKEGRIIWQPINCGNNESYINLVLNLSSNSPNQLSEEAAILEAKKILESTKTEWISPIENKWLIDLDEFREKFINISEVKKLEWLTGKVLINIEYRYEGKSFSHSIVAEISKDIVRHRDTQVINEQIKNFIWDSFIHPKIKKIAKSRFDAHHYADSVEAALKEINTIIKNIYKEAMNQETDGSDLMKKAFSPNNAVIKLDDLSTQSGKDIQRGYMEIFSGAITGIRNPKAHANISIDINRAIHLLFLASLLMYKIDERIQ